MEGQLKMEPSSHQNVGINMKLLAFWELAVKVKCMM